MIMSDLCLGMATSALNHHFNHVRDSGVVPMMRLSTDRNFSASRWYFAVISELEWNSSTTSSSLFSVLRLAWWLPDSAFIFMMSENRSAKPTTLGG